MNFLTACKTRYYSKDNSEEILTQIQDKMNPKIKDISHEMLCIFYDIINKEPSSYYKKSVCTQTYVQLDKIYKENGILLNEDALEHFLLGYQSYRYVTDNIRDLEKLNDSTELKNRLYRIPTYEMLTKQCLLNFYSFILHILDQISTEDVKEEKCLQNICDILQNHYFNLITFDINLNLLEAILQGGIFYRDNGQEIVYTYQKNGTIISQSMLAFELDHLIHKVYDITSGALLGICTFLNEHINEFTVNRGQSSMVAFGLMGMELSLPTIRCNSISESSKQNQLNIDLILEDSNKTFILQTAIEISMLVYERFGEYEKYYLTFRNSRLQTSYICFTNQDIYDMMHRNRSFDSVLLQVEERKGCQIWEPSTEVLDLEEIKYHRFTNFKGSDYLVNKIEDVSLTDRKRLKAYLYIGDTSEKIKIMEKIHDAIGWLKQQKNVSSPLYPHKAGEVEADSIYLSVFCKDLRTDKDVLPSKNENFICCVEYNMDGQSVLENGGLPPQIWNQLHHEKIGTVQIAWREERFTHGGKSSKVGRNDPCPCGSGKKYKKCCMNLENNEYCS